VHIVLTNSKKCQGKTLVTKKFSSPNQRERASKSSTPLPLIRKEIKNTTIEKENEFSQVGQKFHPSILLHMGELCPNEIQMISIYTKCPKTCLSKKIRVKHKIRGQHPLSFPFTKVKVKLFNSYFAHKRNPRNMMSSLFWATFGTFGQVVELEKENIGLQRPIVFKKILYCMIHVPLPSKLSKCPHPPPNPSPRVTSSP
jgi:hypothetical protein